MGNSESTWLILNHTIDFNRVKNTDLDFGKVIFFFLDHPFLALKECYIWVFVFTVVARMSDKHFLETEIHLRENLSGFFILRKISKASYGSKSTFRYKVNI